MMPAFSAAISSIDSPRKCWWSIPIGVMTDTSGFFTTFVASSLPPSHVSSIRKNEIPNFLEENNFIYVEAVIYETAASDLSDLADVNYDVIAFYSPSGIQSLFKNFPDFKQNNTRIAAFGPTTAKAVTDAGLFLDIQAPHPNAPSMTGALELYIKEANQVT